jgi:cytochrome c oxidase assembly protein subunit 23
MASKGMNVSGASQVTDEKDPCADEARLSMKCLNDNGFDKNACRVHFENYKACKTFWMKVR